MQTETKNGEILWRGSYTAVHIDDNAYRDTIGFARDLAEQHIATFPSANAFAPNELYTAMCMDLCMSGRIRSA